MRGLRIDGIDLVEQDEEGLILQARKELEERRTIVFFSYAQGIDEEKNKARLIDLIVAAIDTQRLDRVIRRAQARRIDEAEEDTINIQHILDRVTGRAMDITDDSALFA